MEHNYSRIARNTVFLYIRLLLIMAATLYMSRIVLDALGVSDFGIYNVVGGLSSALIFFSSAFTNATQRFLNFELGKNDLPAVGRIFSISLLIHIGIALAVLAIGGAVGVWYVNHQLVLPHEQIPAARIVLWATLLSLVFTFIGSVYESVLIARENMKLYAYLGLFDAFAKLGVSFAIRIFSSDRLIFYALLLLAVKILYTVILACYCRSRYPEAVFRWYWNGKLARQLFSFIGWNAYSCGTWIAAIQGTNLVLNAFFGPVVNAANAITQQVTNAIGHFSASFLTAVRPQLIQSYAANDSSYFRVLLLSSARFSAYLVWIFILPIWLRTDYVLALWLKEVPETTVAFIHGSLFYALLGTLHNPLWMATLAVGEIKKPVFYGGTVFMLALPASYVLLYFGFPAAVIYPALIFSRFGFLSILYIHVNRHVGLKLTDCFRQVIVPCTAVLTLSYLIMRYVNTLFPQNFISLAAVSGLCLLLLAVLIWTIGIRASEREMMRNKLRALVAR